MNIIEQTNFNFDFDKAKADVLRILEEHNFIPQIGLTHSPKSKTLEEKILESTGSIFDFENREFRFKETDFNIFNDAYKNTYLYEMYKTVPNIGRFRIMTMDGPKCYTLHRDLTKRDHYVIETNPDCLFLFSGVNKIIHIPCDHNLYLVDTRHKHTFVNGSKKRRIHLVMDDLSTLK
jgi:hypothetical protein